jgi:hypothetical protein
MRMVRSRELPGRINGGIIAMMCDSGHFVKAKRAFPRKLLEN